MKENENQDTKCATKNCLQPLCVFGVQTICLMDCGQRPGWIRRKHTNLPGLNFRKMYHTFISISNVGPDAQKWPYASQKMPTESTPTLRTWWIPPEMRHPVSLLVIQALKTPAFRTAQPLDVSMYYRAKQQRWTSDQIQRKSWRESSTHGLLLVSCISGWIM